MICTEWRFDITIYSELYFNINTDIRKRHSPPFMYCSILQLREFDGYVSFSTIALPQWERLCGPRRFSHYKTITPRPSSVTQ